MPLFSPPPGARQVSQPQANQIQVVVLGGMGSWVGTLSGGQTGVAKIELPSNWDKLVAKYKNVVPTFARY
jgi:branched-subunit amino acid ABC-type transport system permease component